MMLDDVKIDYIATVIMLVIALPMLISRMIGSPLIADLGLESEIIYLPLVILILLTVYQRQRSLRAPQSAP